MGGGGGGGEGLFPTLPSCRIHINLKTIPYKKLIAPHSRKFGLELFSKHPDSDF
jgi:hypothetical protein